MTRETGVVKFWNAEGYGNITRDNGPPVAKFKLEEWRAAGLPTSGQRVNFIVTAATDPNAKPRAINVHLGETPPNIAPVPLIPVPAVAQRGGQRAGVIISVRNNSLKIRCEQDQLDFDVEQVRTGALCPLTRNDLKNVRVRFDIDPNNATRAINISAVDQLPRTGDFLHPYYFIPPAASEASANTAAQGHDDLKPGAYFGKLHVKITAVTPLLLPDAVKKTQDAAKHSTFATRVDREGKPLIAATSVKGMLRSAFELITDSRFCVFGKHDEKLPYRQSEKPYKRIYSYSPEALLPKHYQPATSQADFSPAERLFGYVSQKGSDGDGNVIAYRGHLRFGPVACLTDKAAAITALTDPSFNSLGLPLAISAEPKPAQSRFYLRNGLETLAGKKKPQTYLGDQHLAGRKVYPHQLHGADYWLTPSLWTDTGAAATGREYVRAAEPNKLRNSQNRSLKDWVAAGTQFEFDLRLSNVHADDLAALLWLLTLPPNHYHKLGGGKPYGFGSVRIDIDWDHSSVGTGAAEIRRYRAFPTLPAEPKALDIANFPTFKGTEAAKAFLRAAKGLGSAENTPPTHYPRRTTHPAQNEHDKSAQIYDWFCENDKDARMALPLLKSGASSVVLNYTPTAVNNNNGGGNHNGGNAGNQPAPASTPAPAVPATHWPAWVDDPKLLARRTISAEHCWVSDELFRFWNSRPVIRKQELFDTSIASALTMITGDYANNALKALTRYTTAIENASNP